jgi:hypothetical protein
VPATVNHLHADEPGSGSDEEGGNQTHNVALNAVTVPKMTPEIRQHCITNRLCFRCRTAGHSSSSCPRFASSNRTMKPSSEIQKKDFD